MAKGQADGHFATNMQRIAHICCTLPRISFLIRLIWRTLNLSDLAACAFVICLAISRPITKILFLTFSVKMTSPLFIGEIISTALKGDIVSVALRGDIITDA